MSNVVEMNPRARMVCIGDSITEQGSKANGWVSHLAEAYLRKADVINRGFSGYNTDHALVALRHMLHSSSDLHGCAVVTIMLGSNDCVKTSVQPVVSLALASQQRHEFPPIMVNCASDNCARMLSAAEVEQELASAQFVRDGETMFRTSSQHVPLPRYESNLRTMIELLRTTSPSTRVIVIAPPPINGPAWLAHMQSTYGPDFTSETNRDVDCVKPYVLACLRLSAELNIPCVSLYDEMLAHPDWTLFLLDGLHLNDKGQAFVAAKLLKLIREHVPQCSPETLPMHFPSHRAIRLPPM